MSTYKTLTIDRRDKTVVIVFQLVLTALVMVKPEAFAKLAVSAPKPNPEIGE